MEKFSDIKYVRPDITAYKASLSANIEAVRSVGSYAELKALWLEQEQRSAALLTMRTVASIRSTINAADTFYEAEMRYFNTEMPSVSIMEAQAKAALLASPFKGNFEAEFGHLIIDNMKNAQRFADERIVPLQIREAELTQAYSKASSLAVTDFKGEKRNFYGLLKFMESTDRETRREAFKAWAALYESIAPELDGIYDEMVKVRTEMAHILGFKTYTLMAYPLRRRFDYDPADVDKFHTAVKTYVTPVCAALFEKQRVRLGIDKLSWYDESLVFPDGNADPDGSKDELLKKAQVMYRELSSETGEFFDFMMKYDMFDLESKPGKRPGGYCTMLPSLKAPFIFSNFNGTAADIGVLTHEAGHAFEAYTASRCQPLLEMCHSTSEINEIHSMAMEHFTYPWMESFFGSNTSKHIYTHLWQNLSVIPYMCCVDEFQHKVYDYPEMTAADRRRVWHELEGQYMPWRSYDGNEFLEGGGFWMQKQHIFLYPFYYIEYALAQLCAFQFYLRMEKDRDTAWSDYLRLCRAGGSLGYFDLLRLADLEKPFDISTVKDTVNAVAAQIDKYEQKLKEA